MGNKRKNTILSFLKKKTKSNEDKNTDKNTEVRMIRFNLLNIEDIYL
jgi:hypothetical protein